MRRREFITFVSGAAATWPLAVRGQQVALPVIGFLGSVSADGYAIRVAAFLQGLKEAGYVDGQNVKIEYRWANGQYDRLPALATELVQRQVAVLVAGGGTPTAMAAKAATTAIPVVFAVAVDPVRVGLVASLTQPGGNLTGVTDLDVEVGPKRLELLRDLLPKAANAAVLINPANPTLADAFVQAVEPAGRTLGLQVNIVRASTEQEIDAAFANLVQLRADGVIIMPDVFFNTRSGQLAALALRNRLPAIYQFRPFAAAGGLMSYGSDQSEYYRLVGLYAGKVLKGEKPTDLPVQQVTKIELIVNLKTAKALGVTVPLPLLGRADEVIE
jgi:putative tryptophan/tyrosine transport system substrate-binding protein